MALFGFDPLTYSVDESDGTVTLTVELQIGNLDRDVELDLTASDGTAIGITTHSCIVCAKTQVFKVQSYRLVMVITPNVNQFIHLTGPVSTL